MNKYLKNLNKIEFAVTYACTGRCKHCSEGDHSNCKDRISPAVAADAVKKIAGAYQIQTVMAFGGEPLLCTDAVYAIMTAAKEMNVAKRQLITNGFFTQNNELIRQTAKSLANVGVNDLLLSVDAFHQETIPLEVVRRFAEAVQACGVPIRLQPAWLVDKENENPYNVRTREILESFSDMGIAQSDGNIIFPQGNALKYLGEYFTSGSPQNPYIEDPYDVRCVSFAPNGDVLNGNVYNTEIMELLRTYTPE